MNEMGDKDFSHLILELQSCRAAVERMTSENDKVLQAVSEWSQRCNELFLENEKMKTELMDLRNRESIRMAQLGSHWASEADE